jgi:hypothetical protein
MAVSAGYLTKLRYSVRRNAGNATLDAELTDIIEECRLDLQRVGVISSKAVDETDTLILGAIRCFVRWKFGLSNEDAEANRADYYMLRDELKNSRDYIGYAITFSITTLVDDESTAVADAYVTFNGETKQTGAAGTTVFYYVKAGVNQKYVIEKTGYTTQAVDLDVTATATVSVVLEAV